MSLSSGHACTDRFPATCPKLLHWACVVAMISGIEMEAYAADAVYGGLLKALTRESGLNAVN
jgi:hypothetical protein